MDHHIITIDASPAQLGKLRRGRLVRIKKGTGFNVIVHPETYRLVSRAFAKDKGVQVALSPEEIELNRMLSPEQHMALKEAQPEMAGQGIFGKKFDKMLKKAGIKEAVYKAGDVLKPYAKKAISTAVTAGTTALGGVAPELVPFVAPLASKAGAMASDYLDRPGYYQKSGIKSMQPIASIAQEQGKAFANQKLNEKLGTNYDYMSRAGLESAMHDQLHKHLSDESIKARFGQTPASEGSHMSSVRGSGLYNMTRRESRVHGGTVGLDGGLISPMPPALKSQPLSANYQMQHFLPPAYQGYNSGAGLGTGLGTGMYRGGRGLYI